MTVSDFLSKLSIFNELSPEEMQSLAKTVGQHIFKKDQTVVFKGTTVEGLHIVATGKVGVHARTAKSSSPVQIAELGPGEIFGEMSILNKTMAGATVKCITDDTLIFVVPEETFSNLLDTDAKVHAKTHALIEQRNQKAVTLLGH